VGDVTDTTAFDALDRQHQRFVEALLTSASASAAYTRVYETTGNAAESGASRLLRDPRIQTALAERRAILAERTNVSVARVLEEYARLAFSSMRTFSTWGPDGITLVDDATLSEDDARCVAEIGQTVSRDGGSLRIKLHDKKGALDKLAEFMGIDAAMVRKLYPGFDATGLDAEERRTRVFSILTEAKKRRQAATG
jgi:phage terminase small subunit